jgi:hypothetical protein
MFDIHNCLIICIHSENTQEIKNCVNFCYEYVCQQTSNAIKNIMYGIDRNTSRNFTRLMSD